MKRSQKRKHQEDEEYQETAKKGKGILKSQEDVLQLGPTEVARGWGLGLGEVSSSSEEYFSCVSFPHKLNHGGMWRLHRESPQPRSPLAQVQERGEIPSPSQVSLSSASSYKTCAPSFCVHRVLRGMKIYYMHVQTKKGVAVSWETEETSEPIEKQLRMEEVTIPEYLWEGTPPSDVSTRDLLSDSEASGEEEENEETSESDSPPGSPVVEERPRARTPDWLVTVENGFRCMACCRVFPTLEILQEHVQHGVREGFSCHVFHSILAHLRHKMESESTEEDSEDWEDSEDSEDSEEQEENEDDAPAGSFENFQGLKRAAFSITKKCLSLFWPLHSN